MIFKMINPATHQQLESYHAGQEDEIFKTIEKGHQAFLQWRQTSFAKRSLLMQKLAALLRASAEEFAIVIATEMGKPVSQGRLEIEKCASCCEHYAKEAERYLQPQSIQTEMYKSFVCYQPIGQIFAIMPWNYPFWQVFRSAVPSIMAGNTFLLKHAPICIGTGNLIQALFQKAGFIEGVFQHIIIDNSLAEKVLAHEKIAALSFTGSEKTGRILGAAAGKNLKKMVLELGGSDPYLVLEDADIDLAATHIVASRLNNCGQVCIAAKRILVLTTCYETLRDKILSLVESYKMGDPLLASTTLGPMAREDLREVLYAQVQKSIAQGATLLKGGYIPSCAGFYYPATVLTNVAPGMPAFDEELFGPVICITPVNSEEEGITFANHSAYGLGAAIFTQDLQKGETLAQERLEAGSCFVNTRVSSDPRLPFGGIKHSGIGRELSKEGICEFVNIKTVVIG